MAKKKTVKPPPEEIEMVCGGKDTTYNKLRKRAKELKKEKANESI